MTDARRVRRPSLGAVGVVSLLGFAVVLALLVAQMRLGRDPVLGARRAAASVAPTTRHLLVRRVVVKRIVVDEIRDTADRGVATPARTVVVAPSPSTGPAPAPATAPAPAPAPAPIVTKSS